MHLENIIKIFIKFDRAVYRIEVESIITLYSEERKNISIMRYICCELQHADYSRVPRSLAIY